MTGLKTVAGWAMGIALMTAGCATSALALTGQARTNMIQFVNKECHSYLRKDADFRELEPGLRVQLCSCVAHLAADRLKTSDILNAEATTGAVKKKAEAKLGLMFEQIGGTCAKRLLKKN